MTGASGSKATQVQASTRERAIGRPTRCVSQSLNAPYARTRATRFIGNNQGASRYTPIKYDYESAAAAYNIANFDPHPDECGGCPQQ